MRPSGARISHRSPAGESPARRTRSRAASVWPGLRSTPSSRARSGKTCPGRASSSGFNFRSASARMVSARSWAEEPDVVPSKRSTETVNGVEKRAVLTGAMSESPSASRRPAGRETQIRPRASLAMKLTSPAVAFSAAMTKSPSFSRSSSSTTTTIFPARIARRALSMSAKERFMSGLRPARACRGSRPAAPDIGQEDPLPGSRRSFLGIPRRWCAPGCTARAPPPRTAPPSARR